MTFSLLSKLFENITKVTLKFSASVLQVVFFWRPAAWELYSLYLTDRWDRFWKVLHGPWLARVLDYRAVLFLVRHVVHFIVFFSFVFLIRSHPFYYFEKLAWELAYVVFTSAGMMADSFFFFFYEGLKESTPATPPPPRQSGSSSFKEPLEVITEAFSTVHGRLFDVSFLLVSYYG